jgi:Tetratricopeptide repeat
VVRVPQEEAVPEPDPGAVCDREGARESAEMGEAIPLSEEALADRMRVLGEDNPDTVAARDDLAGAYYAAGRLGEAIPLYEQTLADSVRLLGPDHPDTLTSRNNLGYVYWAAGRGDPAV